MSHTTDFLDQIARHASIRPSSYAIAKHMGERYGWTRQSVQNYRRGITHPDDHKAVDIAAELELDPMYVVACIQADRAADAELRSMWERMAERARRTAAAVILSALGGISTAAGIAFPSDTYASVGAITSTDELYIMRTLRRLLRWLLGDGDGMDAAAGV